MYAAGRLVRIGTVLLALGCSGEGVVTRAAAPAELIEERRLDANAEDFSSVGRLAVSGDGLVAVPLPQDAHVRLYDSAFIQLGIAGRRGSGPGELQHIGRFGFLGDTLWLWDARSRRISRFARDGSLIASQSLPGAFANASPFTTDTDYFVIGIYSLYQTGSVLVDAQSIDTDSGRSSSGREIALIDSAGALSNVTTPPSLEDERWHMEAAGLGRRIPFAAWPITAVDPTGDRIAWLVTDITSAEGGTYSLTVVHVSGDTLLERSYPFIGEQISQSDRDSAIAAEAPARTAREGPPDLDQQFQRIARERMPPVYAPVQSLLLGLDNTMWLTLRDSGDVRRTIVLDQHGDEIGFVETSTRVVLRQASRQRVWATETDDLGLASVVRYRVRGLR